MLIFDIETGPQPLDQILTLAKPFSPPQHPGEFDERSVKIGNLKDQSKIAEKIEAARAAHSQSVANHGQDVERAREDHASTLVENAPLNPVYGRVLAIGYYSVEKSKYGIDDSVDESQLLTKFWQTYSQMRSVARKIVGANIFGFDLPFLVRRSWILGVDVPSTIRNGRYWDSLFVDVRDVWLLGQQWGNCESSLDHIAKALGCDGKPEGIDGSQFWKLWSEPATKQQAIDYLVNDLRMTWEVCQRIGVV